MDSRHMKEMTEASTRDSAGILSFFVHCELKY